MQCKAAKQAHNKAVSTKATVDICGFTTFKLQTLSGCVAAHRASAAGSVSLCWAAIVTIVANVSDAM
jgi:hypothetical protein